MQIGANDGERYDPLVTHIRSRPWTGVLAEPLPQFFERLRSHYDGSRRIRVENVAVAERAETRVLYHLADAAGDPGLPGWYDALGTFRLDVLLNHRNAIEDIEERVRSVAVECVTFDQLCARAGLQRIDLLQMDTEGYDATILATVDLDRWQPLVIIFEHLHLSATEREQCVARLGAFGYEWVADEMDTVCLRPHLLTPSDGALARAWTEARRCSTAAQGRTEGAEGSHGGVPDAQSSDSSSASL